MEKGQWNIAKNRETEGIEKYRKQEIEMGKNREKKNAPLWMWSEGKEKEEDGKGTLKMGMMKMKMESERNGIYSQSLFFFFSLFSILLSVQKKHEAGLSINPTLWYLKDTFFHNKKFMGCFI